MVVQLDSYNGDPETRSVIIHRQGYDWDGRCDKLKDMLPQLFQWYSAASAPRSLRGDVKPSGRTCLRVQGGDVSPSEAHREAEECKKRMKQVGSVGIQQGLPGSCRSTDPGRGGSDESRVILAPTTTRWMKGAVGDPRTTRDFDSHRRRGSGPRRGDDREWSCVRAAISTYGMRTQDFAVGVLNRAISRAGPNTSSFPR